MSFQWLKWLMAFIVIALGVGCTNDAPLQVQIEVEDPDAGQNDGADAATPDPQPQVDPPQGCLPDQCTIDKLCFDNNTPNPDNSCQVCLVIADAGDWTANDGASCNDGNACTTEDACEAGACLGLAKVCDDTNLCTDDSCDATTGECLNAPNTAECDDADPCTLDDVCAEGSCGGGGETLGCDDENPCTLDACEAGVGCVATPDDGAACDDGDPCSLEDVCLGGACQKGEGKLNCDDENLCTADGCDPGSGCVNEPIADLCADSNPCTDETCDPQRGCIYPFNEDTCDDGSACTEGDQCRDGACLGEAVSLDDGNLCTDLSCDPEQGIEVDFNALPCDDNNACTVGDICAEGGCEAGTDPLICDDRNPCTDDGCDAESGCTATNNTDACDDLDLCTVADVCADGSCAGTQRNCDDGNDCTDDSCDGVDGCLNTLVVSNACRPLIDVDFPPRAATIEGTEPTITVRGSVSSGAGDITSLLINGQETSLQDGAFSLDIPVLVGGNILTVEAIDALGATRRKVQSFLWSPVYRQPGPEIIGDGAADQGLGIFLSAEVLDDGDRNQPPDDFATIFELILGGFDLLEFLPNPVAENQGVLGANYDLFISGHTDGNNVNRSVPEGRVNLEPRDGLLHVDVDMRGVGGQGIIFDIRAQKRSCGFLNLICLIAPGTITGTLTIEFVRIEADIQLEVVGGELVASLLNTSVDIGPTNVNIDGAFLSLFEGLFNGQIGPLIAGVESEFAGQVDTILGPLLADALGALALDTIIDFPSLAEGEENIPVRFKTGYEDVEIEPSGMTLTFAAGAHSPAEVPYTNLGSMGRAGCLDNPQRLVIPGLGGFEMVLTDDLLNQLLHGAWRGGLLEFELPPELLGDVDLSEFGVSDLVLRLSGMLQPTVSDCNEEGELLIHVGDLRIDATMQVFGEPIDVVIFASLEAGLDLRAEEGGIGLAIESVERAELEINVQQEDLVGFESVLADLIEDNLIAALLDLLGGESLGSFPLPAIDLSSAIEGINEPLLISIEPQSIDRSEGNTIVSGVLQ